MTDVNPNYRAGFVALIGQPNAGKSTLLNALLKDKVSIVSDKPQTTRSRVTGILTQPDSQIVFVDAPGTLKSTSGINTFLIEEVRSVVESADVVCLLLAADSSEDSAKELIGMARQSKKPFVVIVTKNDLLGGTRSPKFFNFLLEEQLPFVSISTVKRTDEARSEVLNRVIPLLPKSPAPLYDEDLYTTQTLRQMSAEFVREACFENLHQEVPYGLAVRIAKFDEEGPVVKIRADIVVEKDNHKAIVIGAKGQTIKKIGTEARQQIERIVGSKVFLELHVQVKENWTKNPRILKELGYVVPQK
jgi:GTPase